MNDTSGISIYPVGVLAAWKNRRIRPLRYEMRYLRGALTKRNWRSFRNAFNGYLAEWDYPPEGMNYYRCGRGWTKKAALNDLGKHLAQVNIKETSHETHN